MEKVADIIIIDGPPSFVPEAMELSTKTDGVLLVIRSGQTRKGHAVSMADQIRRLNGYIVGAVLNQVPRGSDYYNKYYDSAYYAPKRIHTSDKLSNVRVGNLFPKRKPSGPEHKTSGTS